MEIGGFELGEPLGAGAMGEVLAATHRRSGLPAAVKFVRGDGDQAAFAREVQAVAALDHPHIVWVLDHGTTGEGTPWLAMQRAEGTLADRIGAPWADLRRALAYLLDALAHAHARGLLHGDLKPANVLLGCRRDPMEPLRDAIEGLALADFGLARAMDAAPSRVGGTPGFAAPECYGGGPLGPWTDLYAVGCTAWALLTGGPPRDGLPFRPLVGVPPDLEGWLARLLHVDPTQRPRNAAEALQGLVGLAPVESAVVVEPLPPAPVDPLLSTRVVLEAVTTPGRIASGGRPERPRLRLPESWEREQLPWPAIAMLDAGLALLPFRTPRLVGRRAERDLLWSALREVERTGRAQVVQLVGPPGSGRTRLAHWLVQRVLESGAGTIVEEPSGEGLQVVLVDEPDVRTAVEVERRVARTDAAVLWVLAGGASVRERCTQVRLGPLAPHEQEALLRAILPLEPGLSLDVAARTAGSPGAAVELVRGLVARSDLEVSPHGYRLVPGRELPLAVEPLAGDSLEEQLDVALAECVERRRVGERRRAAEVARRAWELVEELRLPATSHRYVAALAQTVVAGAGTLTPEQHRERTLTLVELAESGGFAREEALGRYQLAMLLVEQPGAREERVGQMQRAAAIAEAADLPDLVIKAWYQLGYEALHVADLEAAEELFRRCLEQGTRTGIHFGGLGLCDVLLRHGRGEEALAHARRAVEEGLVSRRHEAAGTLGCAFIDLDRPEEAAHWMERGLVASRELGSTGYEMRMLLNLGYVHHRMGQDAEAEPCYLQGIELSRLTGQDDGLCRANLALIFVQSGRFSEAVQLLEPVVVRPRGRVVVDLYIDLLWLAARLGDGDEVDVGGALREQALRFAEHGQTSASCVEVLEVLVTSLAAGAEQDAARELLDRMQDVLG